MRTYNIYIILLSLLFMLTTVILSLFDQASFGLYFSMYVMEYFVLTLLFTYLNPKARRLLNITACLLFVGFGLLVATQTIAVLGVLP
ncbi:MAG: hypothetical protein ABIH46_01225 [Chloroflexota bacterium]